MCQCFLVPEFHKMRHPVHNFVGVIETRYYVTPGKPVGARVDWKSLSETPGVPLFGSNQYDDI